MRAFCQKSAAMYTLRWMMWKRPEAEKASLYLTKRKVPAPIPPPGARRAAGNASWLFRCACIQCQCNISRDADAAEPFETVQGGFES